MIDYQTQNMPMFDQEYQARKESLEKEWKRTLRLRNVSISVLVFVLLWIACITMAITFCLFQVGFAEKYPTLTLENGDVVPTGYEFIKEHGGFAFGIKFESVEQKNAFYFSRYLWLGLTGAAFLFCFVANILLIVLKKLNNTYDPDEESFFGGAMGWLFKVTGVLMFGATLGWIFGLFSGGGIKWAIVGIVIFIIVFLAILAISLVMFTICGIVISSLNWREANKELKSYNVA